MKRRRFFRCALALMGLKAIGVKVPLAGPTYRVIHFVGIDEPQYSLIRHQVICAWGNVDADMKLADGFVPKSKGSHLHVS